MYCPNPECPHAERTGEPAEYRSGFTHCIDCGSSLVDAKPLPFDDEDSAGHEEFIRARTAKYRRLNVIVSVVAMGGIFAFYIVSASRAPSSDNVGIVFVPLILVTIYGPLVSLICGLTQVTRSRGSPVANGMGWLKEIKKEVMVTQPVFFKICGIVGFLLLILVTLRVGPKGLQVILFPFWAWEYF